MAQRKNWEPEEIMSLLEDISTTQWIAFSVFWVVFNTFLMKLAKDEEDELTLRYFIFQHFKLAVRAFATFNIMVYIFCWSFIFGTIIVMLVDLMIWVIFGELYEVIDKIKPDEKIMEYILSWIDVIFYEYLYEIINGPVPPNIYELMMMMMMIKLRFK